MDITLTLTDAEVAAIHAVSGHDPFTFFRLRLGDVSAQAARQAVEQRLALYQKATAPQRTAIDAEFAKVRP